MTRIYELLVSLGQHTPAITYERRKLSRPKPFVSLYHHRCTRDGNYNITHSDNMDDDCNDANVTLSSRDPAIRLKNTLDNSNGVKHKPRAKNGSKLRNCSYIERKTQGRNFLIQARKRQKQNLRPWKMFIAGVRTSTKYMPTPFPIWIFLTMQVEDDMYNMHNMISRSWTHIKILLCCRLEVFATFFLQWAFRSHNDDER